MPNSQNTIPAGAEYHRISPEEAYKRMSESSNFILLDVRTPEEFSERRIKGAILIPDYEISARAEKELPDRKKVIFVYCRSGARSGRAARTLVSLGYTNVFDFGGINSWPFETIGD